MKLKIHMLLTEGPGAAETNTRSPRTEANSITYYESQAVKNVLRPHFRSSDKGDDLIEKKKKWWDSLI